jgi:hypothetical protein
MNVSPNCLKIVNLKRFILTTANESSVVGMVLEMMPKHFQDPNIRPPGFAIGSAFLRGLLALTDRRLIFVTYPQKKRPNGLLRNIVPYYSL